MILSRYDSASPNRGNRHPINLEEHRKQVGSIPFGKRLPSALTARTKCFAESQRDSVSKPKVARNELPWVQWFKTSQPQRGCGQSNSTLPVLAMKLEEYRNLVESIPFGKRLPSALTARDQMLR